MCKGVGLLYFSFCVETNIIFKSAQKTPSWFPRLTHPDICPSPQMFSLSLSLSLLTLPTQCYIAVETKFGQGDHP